MMTSVYFILLLCSLACAQHRNDASGVASLYQVSADGVHHGLLAAAADHAGGRSDLSGLSHLAGSNAYHGSGHHGSHRQDLANSLSHSHGLHGASIGDLKGLQDHGLNYYRSASDLESLANIASALGDRNDHSEHSSAEDVSEASSRSYYPRLPKYYSPIVYGSRPRLPKRFPARRPILYRSESSMSNELGDSVGYHVSEQASYRGMGLDGLGDSVGAVAGAGSGIVSRSETGLHGLHGGRDYESLRSANEGKANVLGADSALAMGAHALRY